MSSLLLSTLTASSTQEKLYVDDVFSTYLYTGNGSTQTINNGIDLAGKGGLVWGKGRSPAAAYNHRLQDTVNGVSTYLSSNTTTESTPQSTGVTAFNSNGYTLGSNPLMNQNNEPYVSWTFCCSERFFDIVTYTGNGIAGRQIAHSLGVAPGMVIVKRTDSNADWYVYHKNAYLLKLNTTGADLIPDKSYTWLTPSVANIQLEGNGSEFNGAGGTYVAYLFAHDPSAEGIVQCGSFEGGQTNGLVSLGWEPQYLLTKCASTTNNWTIHDVQRGWTANDAGNANVIRANLPDAEATNNSSGVQPTANGFTTSLGSPGQTYIYLAIRRSNKPPTTGTQVYNAIARAGTGAAATVTGVGFAPDFIHSKRRSSSGYGGFFSRLIGFDKTLQTHVTQSEYTLLSGSGGIPNVGIDGFSVGADTSDGFFNQPSGSPYIHHFFRRAPGFMDIVCYTGTGTARTVNHNLGVVPELIIVKGRNNSFNWPVYHIGIGNDSYIPLNLSEPIQSGPTFWNSTTPGASVFTLGGSNGANQRGFNYVAYLFASLPGISKVGSYTGNGTSQTIDCGFSTGARFFLVKATSTTGSWWVYDSARGIVSAADPALQLNSTAAEITSADAVDPASDGIIVNQEATCSINALGVNYIYLAIS